MRPAWPPPGGAYAGPNPTDRGKLGSKRHLIVDRNGVPLAFCVTGANQHDSVVFEELVDALPPIGASRGVHDAGQASYTLTRPTTSTVAAITSKSRASRHASLARGSSAATAWGVIAGSWSARTPGWRTWASCASASNAESISTWHGYHLLAPSSAYDFIQSFVSHS